MHHFVAWVLSITCVCPWTPVRLYFHHHLLSAGLCFEMHHYSIFVWWICFWSVLIISTRWNKKLSNDKGTVLYVASSCVCVFSSPISAPSVCGVWGPLLVAFSITILSSCRQWNRIGEKMIIDLLDVFFVFPEPNYVISRSMSSFLIEHSIFSNSTQHSQGSVSEWKC